MKCIDCKFFKDRHEKYYTGREGFCRKFAPKSLQVAGRDGYGDPEAHVWVGWPEVKSDDFCGDFEPNKQKFDEEMEEYVRLNKELDPDGKNFYPGNCGDAAFEANKRDR